MPVGYFNLGMYSHSQWFKTQGLHSLLFSQCLCIPELVFNSPLVSSFLPSECVPCVLCLSWCQQA